MSISGKTRMHTEASQIVRQAMSEHGIVNVPVLASDIQRRHQAEDIFDIEHLVLCYANFFSAPIVFDRPPADRPIGAENSGLLIDFVSTDPDLMVG